MFSFAICRNAKLKELQFILFESDCPYNSVKKIIINLRYSALKLSQFFSTASLLSFALKP